MTEPPFDLGQIQTSVGPATVVHRGALAVEPRDGLTGRPATGVRVGRENARARFDLTRRRRGGPLDRTYPAVPLEAVPGSRFLLRYTASSRPTVVVRLDGTPGRWVQRRFAVEVRPLATVAAADPLPQASAPLGPYVPVASRLLAPSLLPGASYPLPRGTTGVRFRVTRAGEAMPWTRALAFGKDGSLIGWGHGDEHGEVVVVFEATGTPDPDPNEPGRFLVSLRVLASAGRPPAHAPVEAVPLFDAVGPDPDLLRGIAAPPGYLPAPDRVHPCTVGELARLPDHVLGGP